VHSFNYLGIKYDKDPPHFFLPIYKLNCFCLSPVYGHVLVSFWPLKIPLSPGFLHSFSMAPLFSWYSECGMENFYSQLAIFLGSRRPPAKSCHKNKNTVKIAYEQWMHQELKIIWEFILIFLFSFESLLVLYLQNLYPLLSSNLIV